jgi:iron complex transport system substrate-binding protein
VKTPPLAWPAVFLAIWLALPAVGIAASTVAASTAAFDARDDDNNPISLSAPAQRIVSLAPGTTAMLFAAGAGGRVVGTSDYSNEPDAARQIERVSDAHGMDLERILALRPDVAVVWAGGTSAQQIERLQDAGVTIYRLRVARLEQLPDSLRRLGALTGTDVTAQRAADLLKTRIAALHQRYRHRPDTRVLVETWAQPLYTVGRDELLTDVIHACGFQSAYEDLKEVSGAVTIESALARDPDIVLALAEDPGTAQRWVQQWQRFDTLKAKREGHLFGWSDPRLTALGPGIVDAAEKLCAMLNTAVPARP